MNMRCTTAGNDTDPRPSEYFFQECLQVQGTRLHAQLSLRVARPLAFRAVPIQFNTIPIGVPQVEGLADTVISGAIKPDAGINHPAQCIGQAAAVRIEDGRVVLE